jgi:hypothetical protein
VDLGPAVIADQQPLEVVEPGEGALDHPASATEARAVFGLAAGDLRADSAFAELAPLRTMVVGAISGEPLRPTARAPGNAADARNRVDERDQLGDVVAVAARERPGERDPARLDQEVVLGAAPAAINRARARRGAPFFACT